MNVYNTITGIKTNIALKLPAVLTSASLTNFEQYIEGFPQDQTKRILAVWYSEHRRNTEQFFVFTIQAQLTQVQELESYKYIDAIETYLKTIFASESYGYASSEYNCVLLTNFDNGQCSVMFEVTLTEPLTDCD